ncbi:Reverse transcriptase [Dyella terrae]|nr:Reverse transcriptase [Dyella terrae]
MLPARLLAKFVTINGLLPLGLPESPIISNLVCLDMDRELQAMADERDLRYTRYADDITFSGYANLPSKEDIRHLLTGQGFRLSDRKFRISKRGQAHFVTGLSVSERDYPHVPREMKRKLRQELYFCERFGLDVHAIEQGETSQKTFNRLYGLVNYVSYVERRQADRLHQKWGRIVRRELGEAAYATVQGREYRDIHLIVDESEFKIGEQKYLAICVVRLSELDRKQRVVRKLLLDYVTTLGAKGEIDALKDVGVHFTEVHYDLRTKTLDLMLEMLWSASVHFAKYESGEDYEFTWLKLFKEAMHQELVTADGIGLEVLVEENDKVSSSALKSIVDAQYQHMELAGSRRPRVKPDVKRVGKSDTPILTLPDFVLAAFRHNVLQVADERVLDFERIRDKVRYIHDHDLDAFYTRKKPFVEVGSA